MDTMMKGVDPEETEINLDDSEYSEDLDDVEIPVPLWKAPLGEEEEEEDATATLVDVSDTKPLLNERDPRGVNNSLQVTFEDVIAEPVSLRSGDRIWIWSHALFEVTRVWIYRIVTVLLAVPVSIISGVLFAIFSFLHIWMVSPCIRYALIGTGWLQTLWTIVLDIAVRPFATSAGRCCGGMSVRLEENRDQPLTHATN